MELPIYKPVPAPPFLPVEINIKSPGHSHSSKLFRIRFIIAKYRRLHENMGPLIIERVEYAIENYK